MPNRIKNAKQTKADIKSVEQRKKVTKALAPKPAKPSK